MLFSGRRTTLAQSTYFDMWRGVSALVVLIGHMGQVFFPDYDQVLAGLAGAAVMAFFGLSGFFIHKSIARCHSNGVFDYRSFFLARVNRILPPFVFCLALTVLLWLVAPLVFTTGTRVFETPGTRDGFLLDGLLSTALFLNGFVGPTLSANGALWSLTYEIWYYALAALVALALTGRRIGWIAAPIFIVLTVVQPWFAIWGLGWLGGFVLSMLHANDRLRWIPKFPSWPIPVALLALLAFAPPQLAGKATLLFEFGFGAWFVHHMAMVLQRGDPPVSKLVARSADFSYSLYVVHFPILLFAYGIDERPWVSIPAAVAALLVAILIGGPIERWKPFAAHPPVPKLPTADA